MNVLSLCGSRENRNVIFSFVWFLLFPNSHDISRGKKKCQRNSFADKPVLQLPTSHCKLLLRKEILLSLFGKLLNQTKTNYFFQNLKLVQARIQELERRVVRCAKDESELAQLQVKQQQILASGKPVNTNIGQTLPGTPASSMTQVSSFVSFISLALFCLFVFAVLTVLSFKSQTCNSDVDIVSAAIFFFKCLRKQCPNPGSVSSLMQYFYFSKIVDHCKRRHVLPSNLSFQ